MRLVFEEVELLARLEIEMNLETEELSKLVERLSKYSHFDVEERITNFFLRGVQYGLDVDEGETTFDLELELLNAHGELSGNQDNAELDKEIQENFEKLFSKIFLSGAHWSIQHRLLNDNI